jgi:hypothetical protein
LAGFVIGFVPALVLSCFLFTGVAQVIVLPHWSTDIKRPNGARKVMYRILKGGMIQKKSKLKIR